MHETMVAQNVLNAILQESEKRNMHPVGAKISCGQLTTLNDDVFCFAFAALAKETLCEGIELRIEHKPVQAECRECEQIYAVDFACPSCSSCGSEDFQLLADAPLLLEEIDFDEE
jgi:hydrogenase nickel incorporation protein HypA/HybF